MRVEFWGTRGSVASPGPDTMRYGGNTSSVAVRGESGGLLILDAGTGLRTLGAELMESDAPIHILLTHLHMDHIQGLGFFAPLYQSGREVHVWGPPSTHRTLRRRLARYLSPPLFPVRLREIAGRVICHDIVSERFELGEFEIAAELVSHPDPTLGFRIESGGRSVTYLPDHEPQLGLGLKLPESEWLSGYSLAEGADLLIHDAQYTAEEYATRVGWGHCTIALSVAFGEQVGAATHCLFHHDPTHTDAQMDAFLVEAQSQVVGTMQVKAAREGESLEV